MSKEKTMSETKHTPTPWKIRPVGRFGFHLDSTHPGYGSAAWVEGHGDHAKQDAAFIVEAVNNYAALAASHKALVTKMIELRNDLNCVCKINKVAALMGAGIPCTRCELDPLIAQAEALNR